jgi:hypothetical protein
MRETELQWLKEHAAEVERLAGKWITIEGDKLIAEGDSFDAVYEAARKMGVQIPFIFLVPPNEDAIFVGF